jgi:hypothetical protein
MKYRGRLGAFWSGLWEFLFGSAFFFWVPGVGPLLIAGPLANWIVAALEAAAPPLSKTAEGSPGSYCWSPFRSKNATGQ